MNYDLKQIARELQSTAQGEAYFGNALYVARDLPEITGNDRDCLTRWMHGTQTTNDRFRLQDLAIQLSKSEH